MRRARAGLWVAVWALGASVACGKSPERRDVEHNESGGGGFQCARAAELLGHPKATAKDCKEYPPGLWRVVLTGGDFAAWQAGGAIDGVARAGAGGGFVHPLTSYTLPFAVETALAIAAEAELPGEQLAALLAARARRHWRATAFYRSLGRMLFDAAEPDSRYRIFERFYRLPQGLVERPGFGRGAHYVASVASNPSAAELMQ